MLFRSKVLRQARGLALEPFLSELFEAFDLQPRGAFKITGEQIDGAFQLGSERFILEAKWEKDAVDERPISGFERKIDRRLDNTLGLFISLNGFSDDGVKAVQRSRPNLILMDGRDLASVIEGCIDLRELIERKLRFAAETGDIYLPVHVILNEKK